ncbi:MAG: DUF72 domain-containing protein [Desulfurivibrio sp.]|nr:MAG: DUF72 domain-containing protein [Desulfurivibrio sp.]
MEIRVGTSGYGYKEWKGLFYPEKIAAGEMLGFYAQRLGVVEINYTFYHMPTAKVLASWAAQVPDDFAFALKAPQLITHRKRLREVDEETDYFFRTLAVLDKKMGPALFQFPAGFRANRSLLEDFLALLPENRRCAFEFRSSSWLTPEILELLREKNCSLCIADTDEKPAEAIISTASWGYLRLRRSAYGEADLARWRERILAQPWQQAFVFFKHEEEARGPAMAMHFRKLVS